MKLDKGGESWAGWTFGTWGRAREWYLFDPQGNRYSACEILDLRALELDVNHLTVRVRELEGLVEAQNAHFNAAELATLHAAGMILERLPAARRRWPRAA